MSVPTAKQLLTRADKSLWMDLSNIEEIADFLKNLPDPDSVGTNTVIEMIHSLGYTMGWAIVQPDLNAWICVPTESKDTTSAG